MFKAITSHEDQDVFINVNNIELVQVFVEKTNIPSGPSRYILCINLVSGDELHFPYPSKAIADKWAKGLVNHGNYANQ